MRWFRVWLKHRRCKGGLVCPCQVEGYLWYADGHVWALNRRSVEVITRERP